MVSRRFWSTVLLGLGTTLGATPVLAQGTGTSTSTTLQAADFNAIKLRRLDGDTWVDITETDQKLFFNQARCQCNEKVKVVVTMASASIYKLNTTKPGARARLYVGNNCATLVNNNQPTCGANAMVAEQVGLSVLTKSGWEVEVSVGDLFKGVAKCNDTKSTNLWLWIDTQAADQPDITGDSAPHLGLQLDGTPPPLPTNVSVEGGNEALKVSWADMSLDNADLAGYLVFCMRGDGIQVFNPSYWDDQYMTCSTATPLGFSSTSSDLKSPTTTAMPVSAPTHFQKLNPDYLCSGRISSSETSARIRILQNGIPYTVGVAAVDLSGNVSPITGAFLQRPVPTVDFYKEYRGDGGASEGGYCSLGGGTGKSKVLLGLAGAGLLGLSLLRRRRRRKALKTGGLMALLVLLGAGSAHAQGTSNEGGSGREGGAKVDIDSTFEEPRTYRTPKNFAFELRFGAYRPDVDSEFSDPNVHPYKDLYGGKRHLMSQFEFDWQLFQSFGSLALGASIGYYSQSAKAFEANADGTIKQDPTTGEPVRSGDKTSIRLIPMAGLLVYRFDVMASHWGIPLVPYAKLGLNYTFWRITDGNGNIPHYVSGGRGSGGTWGWQAAAGLSLMLDFLDSDAARSLDMETGVNHTYLFFEWDKVQAKGLGKSDKLHVGDSSWVLGLMFEF